MGDEIPGLFYTALYECNYLPEFVLGMLRNGGYNRVVAMKLISRIETEGIYPVLTFEGALEIVRVLALELLPERGMKINCVIVLYNFILADREQYLMKYFELIDFANLLEELREDETLDVFDFVLKIVETYKENPLIERKVFTEC